MGQLTGKTAIVTGGGSGIGKGIALAFAGEGCNLVLVGRTLSRLQTAQAEMQALGVDCLAVRCDVACEADVQALFAETMAHFGRLDILVNSAGAFDDGPLEELTLDQWNNVLGACLTGPFLCTREAFKIMKPAGGGRIINIGSISASRTRVNMAPYTSAKFGVWGLTQAAALEGRDYGIAVSCLHPGNTAVERRMDSDRDMDDEPMIATEEMARVALLMATLPPDANMLEAIVLPLGQKYIGRG